MTTEDILNLLKAAKAQGVSRLKVGDFEVQFNSDALTPQPQAVAPDLDPEIKHKVEELKSVMQLDDAELINRMFPIPKEEDEGAA